MRNKQGVRYIALLLVILLLSGSLLSGVASATTAVEEGPQIGDTAPVTPATDVSADIDTGGVAPSDPVQGDTGVSTGTASPNDTQRSMLKFFREEADGLAVKQTSTDELMVYGTFLSNFFVPGVTTIKDIKGAALSEDISTKFFGSSGNSTTVNELNTLLYEGVAGVMSSSRNSFGLYAKAGDTNPMTGEQFMAKVAGKDTPLIYNQNKTAVMDVKNSAVSATFKLLFGISPDFVISKTIGLRTATGMYMDGFGNIWGSYNKDGNPVTFDDFVLILPSAMNPMVFSADAAGATSTSIKFPINNVFAMGAIVGIKEDLTQNVNNTATNGFPYTTPYYNMKKMFTAGGATNDRNLQNLVSIVGIQTPNTMIGQGGLGNSDSVINSNKKSTQDVRAAINSFLNQGSQDSFSQANGRILISVDANQLKDRKNDLFNDTQNAGYTDEQKLSIFNYFMGNTVLTMDKIADDMYYFQLNNQASGGEGNWKGSSMDDLVKKQKIFAKETDNGGFSFYTGAYSSSPFNKFLKDFVDAGNAGQSAYLSNYLTTNVGKTVDTSSAEFIALLSFLRTGYFAEDKSAVEVKTVSKALDLLRPKTQQKWAYGVLPLAADPLRLDISSNWIFKGTIAPKAYGLTPTDFNLAFISLAYKNADFFNQYRRTTTGTFNYGGTAAGGLVGELAADADGKLNAASQKDIAILFYTANVYRIFSMNRTYISGLENSGYKAVKHKETGPLGEYTTNNAIVNGVNNYPGIYWGYMVAMLGAAPDASGNWSTQGFSNKYLPEMPLSTSGGSLDLNAVFDSSGVVSSDAKDMETKQKDIINKIYGLLSEGPNSYRDKLIKSTQDSWIVQTHRSIVSAWDGESNTISVSSGANGSYASVVGYINTPALSDLPLTAWVLDDYVYVYMVFLLFTLIGVVVMVLTHVRTLREGFFLVVIMAIVLVMPQFLVNNVIKISNTVGDSIYSDRFNYWAITQHQKAIQDQTLAESTGDEADVIIASTMANAQTSYTTDVGVRVKWMAPKRDDIFDSLFSRDSAYQGLGSDLTIFRWLFSSFFNQQEYVYDDPLATYLYRPYTAIAQEAKDSYAELSGSQLGVNAVIETLKSNRTSVLGMPVYRFTEVTGETALEDKSPVYTDVQAQLIKDAGVYGVTDSDTDGTYKYWPIASESVTRSIFRSNFDTDAGLSKDATDMYATAFTLSTESPFYYFYNVFKDRYSQVDGSFKSALLSRDVFRVRSDNLAINNKMRDFLDMQGLFTNIVPYLKQSNDYVYGWTSQYGTDLDGYNFYNGTPIPEDETLAAQYSESQLKKESMRNVWKMYSPWVDQIYNLKVYNSIAYAGQKKVRVEDALSPGAYNLVGRDMVFSEADMRAKSYQYSDLTDIERRIQATLNATYTDMMYLTNYRDFDDETLITAAAMMATFNFNEEFSQKQLLGEGVMLYPQGFELKNFNYDAFMRLLLMNSTGEPLTGKTDLYERVIGKTSVFTGILLLAADALGVYVVPTAKIAVLLLLLFLSFGVAISCVFSPPNKLIKSVLKLLGVPSLIFMGSTIGFAWGVSLFMGEGLTGYVGGRTPSLGLTDPSITLLLIIILDIVYVFILWKLMMMLFKGLKQHMITSVLTVAATTAGAAQAAVGNLASEIRGRVTLDGRVGRGRWGSGYYDDDPRGRYGRGRGRDGGSRFNDTRDDGSGYGVNQRTPKVVDAVSTVKDPNLEARVNQLAEGRGGADSIADENRSKRTLGEHVSDLKHSAKEGARSASDTVVDVSASAVRGARYMTNKDGFLKDTKQAGVRTVNYVTSKDGLRRDAINAPGAVLRRVTDSSAVQGVSSRLSESRRSMLDREQEHLRNDLERNANPDTLRDAKRREKDSIRLETLEQKQQASRNRSAAREAARNGL